MPQTAASAVGDLMVGGIVHWHDVILWEATTFPSPSHGQPLRMVRHAAAS